jgi:AraC family transcriptional regulator
MEYIPVREASIKWDISIRRVQYLCTHNLIPGAIRLGKVWAIPKEAEKPRDGRNKPIDRMPTANQPFQASPVDEELFKKIVESFPIPIQVLLPDGTAVFSNNAFIKVFRIPGKEIIDGKYNILQDPNIEKWGLKEVLLKAFQGESIQLYDKKVPAQDLVNRISSMELSFESIFQNISTFPIYNEDKQLSHVVAVFVTLRLYHDRDEIMKSKEYIESHWLEEFDIDDVARAVSLSKYHFARLFKNHTGITPYGYYQDVKISKLKEKLCDISLSISQAFTDCGVDYNGNFAKVFREKVGMTPSQYRASV